MDQRTGRPGPGRVGYLEWWTCPHLRDTQGPLSPFTGIIAVEVISSMLAIIVSTAVLIVIRRQLGLRLPDDRATVRRVQLLAMDMRL